MIGVILLNMGGPDSPAAIKPFLYNLFSDRDIIRLGPGFMQKTIASLVIAAKLKKTMAAYEMIGGKSPLPGITAGQAAALEKALNPASADGPLFRVCVGMRYWHPFIAESLERMHAERISKVVAISLYPHYSAATTGSSIKHFRDAAAKYPMEYVCISSWYDNPAYIEALAALINDGLKKFDDKPHILFSAHSLPQKFVDAGDPYVMEVMGTIKALTQKIEMDWRLSYQSKTGPVKWLAPTTEQMLHELAAKGVRNLLVVPISFVSDHIETLYEIDILYKEMAVTLGMRLERTASLNTSELFISALAGMAKKKAVDAGWI